VTPHRGLQIAVGLLGTVALVAGAAGLLWGAALVQGGEPFSASVDSELRFFAAWYATAGVLLLRSVAAIEAHRATIVAVSAAFFVAACGRALSLVAAGPPHPLYLVLMVIEFALPAILLPWHAAVVRRAHLESGL
jgi:hypothetical protein